MHRPRSASPGEERSCEDNLTLVPLANLARGLRVDVTALAPTGLKFEALPKRGAEYAIF